MTRAVTDPNLAPVQVDVIDADGTPTGKVSVPGEIFDAQANIPLMHQVVVAQLAAARQGTHKTKTRGEVTGGGKKPYRQKGTGRARQGSIRAPQFAGGGVVHGPVPRDHSKKVPKKMKAAALRGALSDRARDGRLHVVSLLLDAELPSTKAALAALNKVVESRRTLVVLDRGDEVTWKSLRNVPTVHLLTPDQLNTYDVLVNDHVVFTTEALRAFLGGDLEITQVEAKPKKAAAEGKADKAKSAAPDPERDNDQDEEAAK
jgi:large subunit ribosomal protein L4